MYHHTVDMCNPIHVPKAREQWPASLIVQDEMIDTQIYCSMYRDGMNQYQNDSKLSSQFGRMRTDYHVIVK